MMTQQPPTSGVYIFWDNSNLIVPAKYLAEKREGISAQYAVRLHFANLFRLAAAGRPVIRAYAVGSIPPEHDEIWDRLRSDTGIEVELYELGEGSRTEQGVDQCLQTHMLRACIDNESPHVAVVLTGDGKGYEDGVGFHADLERLYEKGWGIEVLSWNSACNKNLKAWAQSVGAFVNLDEHYYEVTFLKGTRSANYPRLTHRKTAKISLHNSVGPNLVSISTEKARADSAEARLAQFEEKEARKRKYAEKRKRAETNKRTSQKKRKRR